MNPITHLMFMDDLKVFEQSKDQLGKTIKVVEGVSEALGMTMGLKKCAVAHVEKGKIVRGGNLELENEEEVKEIKEGETYRYLGVFETNLAKSKEGAVKEYIARTR